MIQSAHIKNIEPKASPKAKVKAEGEVKSKANGVENNDEGEDFASELKASLSTEEVDLKVKPVDRQPLNRNTKVNIKKRDSYGFFELLQHNLFHCLF